MHGSVLLRVHFRQDYHSGGGERDQTRQPNCVVQSANKIDDTMTVHDQVGDGGERRGGGGEGGGEGGRKDVEKV